MTGTTGNSRAGPVFFEAMLATLLALTGSLAVAAVDLPPSAAVKTLLAERSCARCHTPGLPTARAGALRTFDLSRDDWYSGMTGRQLQVLQQRLFTQLSPAEARAMGSASPDRPLTDAEKATVLDFVLSLSR